MKKLLLILVFALPILMNAQNTVYNLTDGKQSFTSEKINLDFDSGINLKGRNAAAVLLAAIPLVVDLGFKLTTKYLEKEVKKYSAEYSAHNSYLQAADGNIPVVIFSRGLTMKDKKEVPDAIKLKLTPVELNELGGVFYYYVSKFDLSLSSAKTCSKSPSLDYAIELKIDYSLKGEKKTIDFKPIVISSAAYGPISTPESKYRTDLVSLPKEGIIIGASIKIVETNPGKVRAEKILSIWSDNKDDVKTIINNFLPKEEKKEDKKEDGKKEEKTDEGKNTETSSTSSKPKPQK